MRLSKQEISAIIEAFNLYKPKGQLRLYGSRVDNHARGGDIDLLIILENKELKELILKEKYKILVDIKDVIGDQKIDLLITDQQTALLDTFIQNILPNSIVLKTW